MPVLLMYVSEEAPRWKLRASFRTRWFDTQAEAMAAAREAAIAAAKLGNKAQVMLADAEGVFQVAWETEGKPPSA